MHKVAGTLNLSAGDLVGHLNCRYLTQLDFRVANGELEKPKIWDPVLEVLAERGMLHELGFIEHIEAGGLSATIIEGVGVDAKSLAATSAAMARGDAIIVQGALQTGCWNGRTDVLRRVETPSRFGPWSYEVIDTKLARETKGNTILQISLYSDLLSVTQRLSQFPPSWLRRVQTTSRRRTGSPTMARTIDTSGAVSSALSRDRSPVTLILSRSNIARYVVGAATVTRGGGPTIILSLVAGISKSQIAELERHGIANTAALAALPLPLQWRPDRGAAKSFEKIREQARIQVEGRTSGTVLYETLPLIAGFGLSRLPEPSPGDIFFDFEGDPFVGDGGLEFLFGYVYSDGQGSDCYVGDWASNRQEERGAFERFVDFVTERLKVYPDLHIYHFAPYEPAAMKRLMGRYATRENEVDSLLRAEVFVDLFSVVRHGIRASVESYSIKKLEPLYSFVRTVRMSVR
jgi:predicted RecB family nuclease